MLKKFFISMLGTIAGIWVSTLLFVLAIIFGFSFLIASVEGNSENQTPKSRILYLNLAGVVPEREVELTFTDVVNGYPTETVANITTAIRLAANDKKIEGIYIDCGGASIGTASLEEISDALSYFKETGKWIYAYADNYEQGEYYLASIADKVYLNPVGSVNVHGLSATTLFFKNLLDKVGVEMQIVKVGDYKSAVEPFIRTDMSEPSYRQTKIFVDNIWDNLSAKMAENRGVSASDVDMWADSLSFTWDPQQYVDNKIVTTLAYRSEVEKELREKVKIKKDADLPFISPSQYMAKNPKKLGNPSKKHIAVLYATGDIVDQGKSGIVGATMAPQIQDLANDDNVIGLVLRVNSGGGSAFASEQIWKALEDFKATGKPFFVSMGDYAASGGYYISCGADSIYADNATLTGSIGIFGMIPNAEKLITEKIGVNYQVVETNPNTTFPTLYKRMDQTQYDAMQGYIERGYETFVSRVAAGRNLPVDSVKAIGGGRVWDGTSALEIGLVDVNGTLNQAIADMAERLGMNKPSYVAYPQLKDQWFYSMMSNVDTEANAFVPKAEALLPFFEFINNYQEMNPVQARMEPLVIE